MAEQQQEPPKYTDALTHYGINVLPNNDNDLDCTNQLQPVNRSLYGSLTLPVYLQNKDGFGIVQNDDSQNEVWIKTIPFHLQSNFGFSLGNKWGSMVDQQATEFISTMANLAGAGGFMGDSDAQVSMISRTMETLMWKGSEQPQFSVQCMFVATDRGYNPVKIIKALAETCLPRNINSFYNPSIKTMRDNTATTVQNISNATGNLIGNVSQDAGQGVKNLGSTVASAIRHAGVAAPLYYAPKVHTETGTVGFTDKQADNGSTCTVTLQIGDWFRADKLVVVNISDIQFSKEVIGRLPGSSTMDYGFPLYASCNITLKPFTYITAEDFMKYFMELRSIQISL